MRVLGRFLLVTLLSAALVAASAALIAPQARGILTAGRASARSLDFTPLSQRSVILDRNGNILSYLHAEENRAPITLDQVPEPVIKAILAIEDQDFYEHEGINLRSMVRALRENVEAGDVRQGGSTITQQLVKNTFLTSEQSLDRKLEEAVLAVRLEDQLSKDEILERYLNTVYFGNGAYGVQTAAEVYFGVSAQQLGMEQAVFLAGLIRNPVGYDPFRYPELAAERRNLVVRTLQRLGDVTADEARWLQGLPIPAQPFTPLEPPRDYFLEEVKQRLLADPRLGETPSDRYNALFKGGLTIHTTLDPRMQQLAKEAVQTTLAGKNLDHVYRNPTTGEEIPGRFTAALVSIEPTTGAVRAIHSGEDFGLNQYRLATQGLRQPGSSFKPLVLATALENGFSPNDTINGTAPCTFEPDDHPLLIEEWKVDNYEGSRGGTGSLAAATHRSLNCAYARLVLLVGPDKVAEMSKKLGITSQVDPVPAMTLGTEEVHPIDMAAAYATFAADGVYHEPYFVEQVNGPDGAAIIPPRDHTGERVISEQTARLMNDVLEGVVTGGTGTRARLPNRQVAGKTGTAQNWEDAWFVGYTPQLATAVWMGSPLGKVQMRNVGGIRVTGGSYPAMMWKAFMQPAMAEMPAEVFLPPKPAERGTSLRLEGESNESAPPQARRRRSAPATRRRPTVTTAPPSRDSAGDEPSTATTTAPPTGGGETGGGETGGGETGGGGTGGGGTGGGETGGGGTGGGGTGGGGTGGGGTGGGGTGGGGTGGGGTGGGGEAGGGNGTGNGGGGGGGGGDTPAADTGDG